MKFGGQEFANLDALRRRLAILDGQTVCAGPDYLWEFRKFEYSENHISAEFQANFGRSSVFASHEGTHAHCEGDGNGDFSDDWYLTDAKGGAPNLYGSVYPPLLTSQFLLMCADDLRLGRKKFAGLPSKEELKAYLGKKRYKAYKEATGSGGGRCRDFDWRNDAHDDE